jgi:inosine-uridine nucleoside N-ribohydrolase
LTNLAIALNVEPNLTRLLRGVVVMGGAFTVAGNVTSSAEFNVHADPEAAAQVFSGSFPRLTVVGLDVTHGTAITRSTWERAASEAGAGRAARLVTAVCRRALTERGLDAMYLHDPLAVAVALDPSLITHQHAAVGVSDSDEDRGMTRIVGPGAVEVAASLDVERFHHRFHERLGLSR